jgi:hypothetical protein
MRQVTAFLKIIDKSNLIDFYNSILSYGLIHGAKLPSLDEFLDSSKPKEEKASNFDEKTDKLLEAEALKRLNERRGTFGDK